MNENYIEVKEPAPILNSQRCKFISSILKIFLKFTTILISLIVWYLYDYFIALAAIILSFIIMGIIRSKLRNDVIPFSLIEFQYTDNEIADWYTAKELCLKN